MANGIPPPPKKPSPVFTDQRFHPCGHIFICTRPLIPL